MVELREEVLDTTIAAMAEKKARNNLAPAALRPAPEGDPRRQARALYWQGWRVSHIATELGLPRSTVQAWQRRERWDDATAVQRVEGTIEARLVQLIAKDLKTGGDYKEIDLLGRQLERTARVARFNESGAAKDLNPNFDRSSAAAPKRKHQPNDFSEEQVEKVREAFTDSLFGHQKLWHANGGERTRMILKSRQIGATWYFAREALMDALTTGRNQIFLSASKAQAHIFKGYIQALAREAGGVDLRGDPIVLANGATLYFLGTNARTAQGYHGNFYFDEFFWTGRFEELNKVASGMAMHKQWRKTYFSTPSSIQHEAYAHWSGDRFNKKRAKADRAEFNTSHTWLAPGHTGADRIWRNIVTIEDAIAGGCNLFDIDELRLEYNPEEFDNLLMCGFIDDSYSVFKLQELQRCMVDSWDAWADVHPFAPRPYGYSPVAVGYDPSDTGDTAGLVVLALPAKPGGTFRMLERHQFRGLDFEGQAEFIRQVTQRYHVVHCGIDTTGMGAAVYQLVTKFYPQAKAYNYSIDLKTHLVLKAKSVISKGRLEFDASWVELAHAFLAIKKVLTPSQRHTTFDAGRNDETGHADLAWATMHALDHEPLEGRTAGNTTIMEIYG